MTSDEALAWIEAMNATVDRFSLQPGPWCVFLEGPYRPAFGATLIEAVTRLKAKLEAGQ